MHDNKYVLKLVRFSTFRYKKKKSIKSNEPVTTQASIWKFLALLSTASSSTSSSKLATPGTGVGMLKMHGEKRKARKIGKH